MGDMDNLLQELEQSVQKEISEDKMKSRKVPSHPFSERNQQTNSNVEKQNSSHEDKHEDLEKKQNDINVNEEVALVDLDEALSVNVEPTLLTSPMINIIQPSPLHEERPDDKIHFGTHLDFRREASTTSLREEESHDPDIHKFSDFSKDFSFNSLEQTSNIPLGNNLVVDDTLKRSGSSRSVLDEGEDDEDEMLKALEMLDRRESREQSMESDDGIVMKNVSVEKLDDVADEEKEAQLEAVGNDFTAPAQDDRMCMVEENTDLRACVNKDVDLHLPRLSVGDVSGVLSTSCNECAEINLKQPVESYDEEKDITEPADAGDAVPNTAVENDTSVVKFLVDELVENTAKRHLTQEEESDQQVERRLDLHEEDGKNSSISVDSKTGGISGNVGLQSSTDAASVSLLTGVEDDNEGLTPEMEAELEDLEKELRSEGLLEDEIEGIKEFVKEEIERGESIQKEETQNVKEVKGEGEVMSREVEQEEVNEVEPLDKPSDEAFDCQVQDSEVTLRTDELEVQMEEKIEHEEGVLGVGRSNFYDDETSTHNDSTSEVTQGQEERPHLPVKSVEELDPDSQTLALEVHEDPGTSGMHILPEQPKPLSVIASTHTVGNVGTDLRLTESELQLGKVKPNWIKDEEYKKCMICLSKFTIVNRRHHCRCCGRVLCSECCSIRRKLDYMEENEKAQRVCQPCNLTLDRIEVYEKTQENIQPQQLESVENEVPTNLPSLPSTSTESSALVRRKSVLKQKRGDSESGQSPPDNGDLQRKRSVRFLDGIAPGTENTRNESAEGQQGSTRPTKPKRISSRKLRELMAQDEGKLLSDGDRFYTICDTFTGELKRIQIEEITERFKNGFVVRLVIKRNVHLVISYNNEEDDGIVSLYTSGLNTLGIEEVLIAYTSDVHPQFPFGLCRLLSRFSGECLKPRTDQLDDVNGIRHCGVRMANSIEIKEEEVEGLEGFKSAFFAPYMDQEIKRIVSPNGPFRVGVLIKEVELPLMKALPMRILTRLGMINDVYPFPIVNDMKRAPVFDGLSDLTQLSSSTILTMFHDFRLNSYQMPYIATSCVMINEKTTTVLLPVWAKEQMKAILNSQMNLLAWACDINEECDSILTCEHLGSSFQTRIFMKESDRNSIGVSFVAFSTGHKGGDNDFSQTLVEDGVVIRFTGDTLEFVQKKLQNGDGFELESNGMKLKIEWVENTLLSIMGPIKSPIDGIDLRGYIQYGLTLERALHSNNLFQNSRNHALRLGSVIRLVTKKLDVQLQSHFFDACEQLTMWLRSTLEDYIPLLIGIDIRSIEIRLHASQDNVGFELANWTGLEEAHSEYIGLLSEKVLPILYQILASNTGDFNVELHLPIVSIYPLPKEDEATD
ncbi:unnamed protein product [Bursaphelenchus xylophilus]|uniref:(pine wood nematode) hypothetical protein n=1 Tax=Bursaphelenchus xylophilus TaxID=6326 RepID=A0A1I7SWR7_BURXY|nr:unnamed protein product [Bursaphelenchus xylophilus]CAG9099844.1 unnamed protein product [Bursaphelenchus xylophilus]